jgi:chromosomal replication initiation ATPase DnaA
LLAGQAVLLDFPREEECVPILHSLLERLNLKLTNRAIDYLIRRMPRNPLSFEVILAKISAESFSLSKPAGLSVVRKIVSDYLSDDVRTFKVLD